MDATVILNAPGRAAAPRFSAAGATHAGRVHTDNEDAFLADDALGLAMAADGVGGHDDGARASAQAVELTAERLRAAAVYLAADADEAQLRLQQENHVRRAVAFAHERLTEANEGRTSARRRAGTTLAGVWAPGGASPFATVFHVGDSRVYRLRGGALEQMTCDHSAYEEWRRRGEVGPAPSQKYILQALGVTRSVRPDVCSFRPQPGDRLLICTDGVSNELDAARLGAILGAADAPDAAASGLVDAALEAGGRDNLTAIVCRIGG